MKNETLIELQNRIYNQNKELGWHDEPRSFDTFVCLFHSELSESMEGLRKGLMDDHLPKYPMFQVELADFVIRCFDYLGSKGVSDYDYINAHVIPKTETMLLASLHEMVSESFWYDKQMLEEDRNEELMTAIIMSYNYAESNLFSLQEIINEKVEYNKHRADHKRENRAKDGGKKF